MVGSARESRISWSLWAWRGKKRKERPARAKSQPCHAFAHCCDKIPESTNLKKEGFILAHGFIGFSPKLLDPLLWACIEGRHHVWSSQTHLMVARQWRGWKGTQNIPIKGVPQWSASSVEAPPPNSSSAMNWIGQSVPSWSNHHSIAPPSGDQALANGPLGTFYFWTIIPAKNLCKGLGTAWWKQECVPALNPACMRCGRCEEKSVNTWEL
jgi:hypothetical protein